MDALAAKNVHKYKFVLLSGELYKARTSDGGNLLETGINRLGENGRICDVTT